MSYLYSMTPSQNKYINLINLYLVNHRELQHSSTFDKMLSKEVFEVPRTHKMMLNPVKYAYGVGSRKFLGLMISRFGIETNPDELKAILV